MYPDGNPTIMQHRPHNVGIKKKEQGIKMTIILNKIWGALLRAFRSGGRYDEYDTCNSAAYQNEIRQNQRDFDIKFGRIFNHIIIQACRHTALALCRCAHMVSNVSEGGIYRHFRWKLSSGDSRHANSRSGNHILLHRLTFPERGCAA